MFNMKLECPVTIKRQEIFDVTDKVTYNGISDVPGQAAETTIVA